MVQCFVPDCKHYNQSHTCIFFSFPSKTKKLGAYRRWIKLIRRADREPNEHSRVCSCHFRDGKKENGPEIFERNAGKLFPSEDDPHKKKRKKATGPKPVYHATSVLHEVNEVDTKENKPNNPHVVVLEAELDMVKNELNQYQEKADYVRAHYAVSTLSADVVRMETGLPTLEIFNIVVQYVSRFQDSINYFYGWKVTNISFEDQIFITLMKVRQNYTNLHLAQLYSCSYSTISNIILTFIHVLHSLLFKDIMTSIPSRDKNRLSSPSSFSQFTSCRIVIDCTDIEIATPSLMSQQNVTYSSYRGMNSFKVLVGVAPNAVITFISKLFPGSVSDKEIVKQSGLLNHLTTGDLILADKGFLIQDVVPNGVHVNMPPFLKHGKFTSSEAQATKSIARCRIHVERANARLKDFKILNFIPPFLRGYADIVFQLCGSLVNLQFPLIKEGCDGMEFE